MLRPSHQHPCIEALAGRGVSGARPQPLEQLDLFGDEHDDLASSLYADAFPVETDKEGRIVLPDYLIAHAGLAEAVVFMGLAAVPDLGTAGRRAAPRRSARARPRPPPHCRAAETASRRARMRLPGHDATARHTPVMLTEVLAALAPRDGGVYLDGTFGGGGYAAAILARRAARCGRSTATPTPSPAAPRWRPASPAGCICCTARFGDMLELLGARGVTALDGVVLDLGVSSFQLDDPARGFSFRADGPLDMRMGSDGPTAADLVNTLPERELADTAVRARRGTRVPPHRPRHRRRARRARRSSPPRVSPAIIRAVLPPDRSGIDPATRSFQALRIRVNDELGEIGRGARSGGRAARARRAAGRGVVPFARGPAGQAVHDRGGRARAGAVAPRPARAGSTARLPRSACSRPSRCARPRPRSSPIRAPAAPGCALWNASPNRYRPIGIAAAALDCVMIRPVTCVCFLLACGSGLYLYQAKHRVQLLDQQIEKTVRATEAAREQIRLLHADWTLLNQPDRLQKLADQFLTLKPANPAQFTSMAELDSRLPAVPPPPAAPPARPGVARRTGDRAPRNRIGGGRTGAADRRAPPHPSARREPSRLRHVGICWTAQDRMRRNVPRRSPPIRPWPPRVAVRPPPRPALRASGRRVIEAAARTGWPPRGLAPRSRPCRQPID